MKAILFDFGGTLDTDGIHWSEKFWEVYQRIGIPVSKQQFEEAYLYSENYMKGLIRPDDNFIDTLTNQILFQLIYLRNKRYLTDHNSQNYLSKIAEVCYSDVKTISKRSIKILDQLRGKYTLGVVSNFYGNLERVLNDLSLLQYFDVVIDSERVGVKKPDAKIFQLALNKIEVPPSDAIVVGDSYDRDIQPAKGIGCTTVWIDGISWQKPKDTPEADYTINSIKEIEKVVSLIEKNFINK